MEKKQVLENIYKDFQQCTGYSVVVGVEQEFYLFSEEIPVDKQCLITRQVKQSIAKFPFFSDLEEEKGAGQFEVQIAPTDNPAMMADMVMVLRDLISRENPSFPAVEGSSQPFAAKPFQNQPGSGMHVHINLIDSNGNNAFARIGEDESIILEQSIAGLMELMPASMKYFAPYEEAYIRYKDHGMESPSTYSWGGDNRTVALRIPSVPLNTYARRIEHRVPCADADPYITIAAIMAGIEYGVMNKLENKHTKIWGNAFLPQYGLSVLSQSLTEAESAKFQYLDDIIGLFRIDN